MLLKCNYHISVLGIVYRGSHDLWTNIRRGSSDRHIVTHLLSKLSQLTSALRKRNKYTTAENCNFVVSD